VCLHYISTVTLHRRPLSLQQYFIKTNSRDQSYKKVEFFTKWRLHEQHSQLPQVGHDHHLDLHVVQCVHLAIFSASGGTGDSKGKRKQNVVPVQMSEVLAAPEEGFSVKGATYTINHDPVEMEVIQ
jgi:hypothetical protein